ncbi:MAG: lipocalin-like domain-containing protein [Acidobacteriota bacterium]
MAKRFTFLTLIFGALWVTPPTSAQRPATPASASLVGTWTLSSVDQHIATASETVRVPNPRGLLVYDAAGHVYEVATRAGRAPYAANQPTPAEAHVTFDNYAGFWGAYRVDGNQIVYRPEGAMNPSLMGQDLRRSFELKGDQLTVTSLATEPNAHGGTRWTWERVPQVENLSPMYRKVVGFWQHVVESRVNLTSGAVISESRRAPSVIVYTPSGFVGVHFLPVNPRKPFAAAEPTDDEARAAITGWVSYYGALTVYPGMVFHHRIALIGPQQGDTLKRFAEVVGSEVHLKFPPTMNRGQESTTLVTLKRLSGEAEMLGTKSALRN